MWQVARTGSRAACLVTRHPSLVTRLAFSLIEVMVVMVLLSLIVIALMSVFSSTQTAFRAAATQSDVLEGGRNAMDLIADDLRQMTPSSGRSFGAVNFYSVQTNYFSPAPASPLFQSLAGVSYPNTQRTNILENFFVLSRENMNGNLNWIGVGYAVCASPASFYSLYRFTTNHPVSAYPDPTFLFTHDFANFLANVTSASHLLDGVVHLRVRAYDGNGFWMNTSRTNAPSTNYVVWATGFVWGEPYSLDFYSNAVPASVEVELGLLEDRTLQRAESIGTPLAQSNYLAQQAGKVHVFRQRVSIPNVDPTAYQ